MDEYDVMDVFHDAPMAVMKHYRSRTPGEKQIWRRVPISVLEMVWKQQAAGFIPPSSEKIIEQISEKFIWNVAQLYGNTVLCGHVDGNMYNAIESDMKEDGEEMPTEDDFYGDDSIDEFMYNEDHGNTCISDYAMDPLMSDCRDLVNASTAEEKLVVLDRMINRIHMRGDIAALFVIGGIDSLDRLSETPQERERRMWEESSRY